MGMPTAFASGTTLVNVFCSEDEGSGFGAHECSDGERQAKTWTMQPTGIEIDVPPRTGYILVNAQSVR